ncbi:MAG: hypothetical protein IT236_18950 [Bacteroidia bacterium]|nr:hypothetical protein [Bacteroidia bacterium]
MKIGILSFQLSPFPHPYPLVKSSEFEAWGEIRLLIIANNIECELLHWQWDIVVILEWYLRVRKNLLTENFPFSIGIDNCIAQARDELYEKVIFETEAEEEKYFDKLAEYFSNHNFSLNGTPTQRFYIGLVKGLGQISYYNESESEYRKFDFDMKKFLSNLEHELIKFFNSKNNLNSNISNRIKKLQEEFNYILF